MTFLYINNEYEIGKTYDIQHRKLYITARGQYGRKNYIATDTKTGRNYILIFNNNPPIVEIPAANHKKTIGA